jgi:dCTP deaminase
MQGVLPSQQLLKLISERSIIVVEGEKLVQPNSLDLPLGRRCWRLRSIRTPRPTETVQDVIKELAIDELDLAHPHILEKHAVYIIELAIEVALPRDVKGDCDGKSSTGRIDVQTKLLCDHCQRYDHLPPGYKGKLYLFVSSNSFLIRVREGLALNQLRLSIGNPALSDEQTAQVVIEQQLLYSGGKPLSQLPNGAVMHLDLHQPVAGYRAKQTNSILDLGRHDNPAEEFWEPIAGPTEAITLDRNHFYILSTLEQVRVPAEYCMWVPPFRPEFGEFRSHYAGFIDSGWGYGTGERLGDTITLEVRSNDNSLTLLHGAPVSPLLVLRVAEKPSIMYSVHTKSNYGGQQGPRLAKYFKSTR